MDATISYAFVLTFIAGLSTGIGSLIAYVIKKPKMEYLTFGLGLSAGVMLYVSFMELLPEGMENAGDVLGLLSFFGGMALIAVVDHFIPELENPHHAKNSTDSGEHSEETITALNNKNGKLLRSGSMTAIALALHNFPEGFATFGTAISDPSLGTMIAIAIALHNIPEGVSVSIPIFYATGDKFKAFKYSLLSGLTETFGALLAYLFLLPFLSAAIMGCILAFVSGIMIYIALDEILPTAHAYGHGHLVITGVALGMLIMAITIVVL